MRTELQKGLKSAKSAPGTRQANLVGRAWRGLSRPFLASFLSLLVASSGEGAWQWEETGKTGGPGQRAYAVVVWTGRELLVWGGLPFGIDMAWQNDGWRYAPGSNAWQPMSSVGALAPRQFPVGVWTGRKLVIWGGHKVSGSPDSLQTGACYDPDSDTWQPTTLVDAPAKRGDHTMIWTGSEVIVWGGYDFGGSNYLNTGGRYNPDTDSWAHVSTLNTPTSRSKHTAVWSGSKMIVWGGGYLSSEIKFRHRTDFGAYDPSGDLWTPGPTTGAPAPRSDHSALGNGSGMMVWGGWNGDRFEQYLLQSGAVLDFDTGTWSSLPLTGAPAGRAGHCSAWTGREMIVWGGSAGSARQSGARFEPASGIWSTMPTANAPTGGTRGAAAWTGEAFYLLHDRLALAYETGPYSLDGIPDDWQYHYFGVQNQEGAADQDPDADGQSNLMEVLAGTIPTDSRSRLTLAVASLPTGELEFSLFPGRSDRTYRLERSTLLPPIEWQTNQVEWSDHGDQHWTTRTPRPTADRQFYRIAVEFRYPSASTTDQSRRHRGM